MREPSSSPQPSCSKWDNPEHFSSLHHQEQGCSSLHFLSEQLQLSHKHPVPSEHPVLVECIGERPELAKHPVAARRPEAAGCPILLGRPEASKLPLALEPPQHSRRPVSCDNPSLALDLLLRLCNVNWIISFNFYRNLQLRQLLIYTWFCLKSLLKTRKGIRTHLVCRMRHYSNSFCSSSLIFSHWPLLPL